MALTEKIFQFKPGRDTACRLVFSGIFLSLVYGYFSGVLLHQLADPILRFPYVDLTFWLAHLAGIPELFTSSKLLALALDLIIITCSLCGIFFPTRRFYARLFFASYFIYFVIFNSYGTHHTLNKVGILLMPIAFAVSRERFPTLWACMRYYSLLIFSSAFLWKLFRLTWLNPDQGELILKKNLAPYLFHNPDAQLAEIYRWLMIHPALLQILFLAGFLMEGAFIAGFFTRKYDLVLLILFVILVAGFWFFADAFFAELLIFALSFLPVSADKSQK